MKKLFWQTFSLLLVASIILTACGTPAVTEAPAATEAATEEVPTEAVATDAPAEASLSCGTDPVVLNAYFETGFDIPFKLAEEFTKQYPNVTWDIKQDQLQISSIQLLVCSLATTHPICSGCQPWSHLPSKGCSKTLMTMPLSLVGMSGLCHSLPKTV